ncbi:EexN family lipoprotein [Bartonella mastomydis]|uniref:EexN family lipoprotein n=1 Tax=Bartonella mastomydis TaxID=1820002 RepID=UPI001116618E|nr:EexN family lipoprotein [Bartonella mastomydis]
MNKIIIPALLLGTGLMAAGCEKTYSVAEFKKDEKLLKEWAVRCGFSGNSKNCQNARLASHQIHEERRAKIDEENRKRREEWEKKQQEEEAKRNAEYEKNRAQQKRDNNFDP